MSNELRVGDTVSYGGLEGAVVKCHAPYGSTATYGATFNEGTSDAFTEYFDAHGCTSPGMTQPVVLLVKRAAVKKTLEVYLAILIPTGSTDIHRSTLAFATETEAQAFANSQLNGPGGPSGIFTVVKCVGTYEVEEA